MTIERLFGMADMHMECARILDMAGEEALARAQAEQARRIQALSGGVR